MEHLTPGEETMIGALARQVKDGDWAAWRDALAHAGRGLVAGAAHPRPPGPGLGGRESRLALF